MTIPPQARRCECEECLALRAAEQDPGETVAVFEHDGSTYEIDRLGIGSGGPWGEFAVYCDGEEAAEFAIARPVLRPGPRPAGLPVPADELVRLARQALSGGPAGMIRPAAGHLARSPARLRPLPRALRPARRGSAPTTARPVTSTASLS